MFTKLPESRPALERRRRWIAASAFVHAAIIWTVPRQIAPAHPVLPSSHIDLVYVAPQSTVPRATPSAGTSVAPDGLVTPVPIVEHDVAPPIGIPDSIPPVVTDASATTSDFANRDGASHAGISTSNTIGSRPLTEREVDRVAAPRPGSRPPTYPADLAAAGIQGTVRLRFVVDTLGRADPRNVQIVTSDAPQFAREATDAAIRTRYFPAEANGRKVAQLVEQAFVFRLAR